MAKSWRFPKTPLFFSLLGTTYGGDGKTNFALPNLQGSAPIHQGQGPGLSLYDLGQTGGSSSVTLLSTEMPVHTHTANCISGDQTGTQDPATNGVWASPSADRDLFTYTPSASATNVQMNPFATSITGGSLPHNNLSPYLGLNFIIALQGIFPPRS
ncbi:MAG: tail fiber protein [Chthoniobacteraceae bacterium]